MFKAEQLRELIIKPVLIDLLMLSDEAVELLLFTCANESLGGTYLKQIHGPALGIYQMEPETYNDIWQNYIMTRNDLKLLLLHNFDAARMPSEERMVYDLRFATAMARIHYRRVREALPNPNDTMAMFNYYKAYYNSYAGKANYADSLRAYLRFKNS